MDEILQLILGKEILSEETKSKISEHFQTLQVQLKEQATLEVRAELAATWVQERDALAAKFEQFVSESLQSEVAELHESISTYRDLEQDYERKLMDAKAAMAAEVVAEKQRLREHLEAEMETLVDQMSSFLEFRLTEEVTELKESIQEAKNIHLGQEMFEAYSKVFMKSHLSQTGVTQELETATSKIAELTAALDEAKASRDTLIRESKMSSLLGNLSGNKREQMALLLNGVATERLDETYKQFVTRIIQDGQGSPSKQATQVSEGVGAAGSGTVKTGDSTRVISEGKTSTDGDKFREELQRLAGIK